MSSEMLSAVAEPLEAIPSAQGTNMSAGAMAWKQPGVAGLWGLATAKDSLKYWLQIKSFNTFILTRIAFAVYFVLVTLNGIMVLTRMAVGDAYQLGSYPAATVVVLVLVLSTTKERSAGIYIWSAWSFWIFFNMLGFVNATSVASGNFRVVMQTLIKSWINIIAVPWMAFRIISPDKLQSYTKLLVVTTAVGSMICLTQTGLPALFNVIRAGESMRGSGTWENANLAAVVLMLGLFLTRLANWRSRWVHVTVYLILLAGLIGTFSRGAIVSFVAGEFVYCLVVRNYKRVFVTGTFVLLFLSTWISLGILVQNNTLVIENKEARLRFQAMSNLFTGKAGEELESGRLYLWKSGIQNVLDEGSLLFGLGHVGMIKSKETGLAPHNDYIQHFADGGLLGLLAFVMFLLMLSFISWRCKDRTIRASLLSLTCAYTLFCMTADKLFLSPMIGPFLAIIALWAYYTREYPGVEKVQRIKKALVRNLAMSNAQSARPM